MARMMRKWTGRLFAALAAAAFAVFAFEYVGVDVWSEPPTAVSASGLVTGCERLDGGLLLAVEGGADDAVLLVHVPGRNSRRKPMRGRGCVPVKSPKVKYEWKAVSARKCADDGRAEAGERRRPARTNSWNSELTQKNLL